MVDALALELSDGVRRLRAPNPGPMTLTGTNSYLIGRRGAVVIDPGPADDAHLDALVAVAGRVELVLITHRHRDHTAGIDGLVERTGAPVRALLPEHCRGADPLVDGERIDAAGVPLEVVATPGHTSDSLSFFVPGARMLLSGDTILGGSTTVLDHPDGTLADYLATLEALSALGDRTGASTLPGHGEPIAALDAEAQRLHAHRLRRLEQVVAALAHLGEDATADDIVTHVYPDAPAGVIPAARHSIEAQLAHLRA